MNTHLGLPGDPISHEELVAASRRAIDDSWQLMRRLPRINTEANSIAAEKRPKPAASSGYPRY